MRKLWIGILILMGPALMIVPSAQAETGAEVQHLPVLDVFIRSENPLSASGKWQPLSWDAATANKTGRVNNQGGPPGWSPSDAAPAVNGAYWSQAAFSDLNGGEAVRDVITVVPSGSGSYSSLWLDMPRPRAEKSGYELRWEPISGKFTYLVTLRRWIAGEGTTLASMSEVSLSTGSSLALVDTGSSVQVLSGSGTEGSKSLLSASDSTFKEGYAGVSGVGSSRSAEFSAGNFTESPLEGLTLRDELTRSENPLSAGGTWLPLAWDTGMASRKTGQSTVSGWAPIESFSVVNGAYWSLARPNDASEGNAAEMTLQTSSGVSGRYGALWIDMPNPAAIKSGFEFVWVENAELSTYTAKLIRWSSGSETVLASASAASIPVGAKLALVDRGPTVEALVKSGSGGFVRLLSGNGEAFAGGYSGMEASGSNIRMSSFRAGSLEPMMYWGAWVKNAKGESPFQWAAQEEFEKAAGREASVVHFSSPWFSEGDCGGPCHFNEKEFSKIRKEGAIPFFSWGPNGVTATDAEIAGGAEEAYIREWADQAKKWGHPFFLRFAWEMNASWFRWGVGNSETHSTAADFVAMWKKVHGIFVEEGATNVTWVWCPNIDPEGKYEAMKNVYPGPEYVDWTCLDAYNEGGLRWKWFSELLQSSYNTITAKEVAPTKPMIIGETASTELEGSKAEWITKMFSVLPSSYPLIHGLLWFDKRELGPGGNEDWPIESSTAATAAFAAGLQSALPAAPEYKEFEVSPIPPTP